MGAEGDIDILLDKFHQENQGLVSSSLAASSVSKSASLDVGEAPACTSEWCRGAVAKLQAGGAASRGPQGLQGSTVRGTSSGQGVSLASK